MPLRFWFATVIICLLCQKNDAQDSNILKVRVDLVLVNVSVTDSQGYFVPNLLLKDFQLWEDKVLQNILYCSTEEVPAAIGVVLDVSASMRDKLQLAKTAAKMFVQHGTAQDEYFLVAFNAKPKLVKDITFDSQSIQTSIGFMGTNGMTAWRDALYFALEHQRTLKSKRRAVLIITDGDDNASRHTFPKLRRLAEENDVQIYAVGIMGDSWGVNPGRVGRGQLRELADLTGGRAIFIDSAEKLPEICAQLADEIRSEYVLGYASSNLRYDNAWRKIRVKVTRPDARVRFKHGYFAEDVEVATH